MGNEYILAIDLGTTGVKGVLFNLGGREIASYTSPASGEIKNYNPQTNWSEQDPAEWKQYIIENVR